MFNVLVYWIGVLKKASKSFGSLIIIVFSY